MEKGFRLSEHFSVDYVKYLVEHHTEMNRFSRHNKHWFIMTRTYDQCLAFNVNELQTFVSKIEYVVDLF